MMLDQITFLVLERYEKYIESLIQLTLYKQKSRNFPLYIQSHFGQLGLDSYNLLPQSLQAKIENSSWLKKYLEQSQEEFAASCADHIVRLEKEVQERSNDLAAFINAIDKIVIVRELYPNFPLSISLAELKQHIIDVLKLRYHQFPLAYFIRNVQFQGFDFAETEINFDLRYYDLDLMLFFEKAESHIIRVRNKSPLQLSYHYFFNKNVIGDFSENNNIVTKLLLGCSAMISMSGESVYNGIRHFQPSNTLKATTINGRKIYTKTESEDVNRITLGVKHSKPSVVGLHFLGSLNSIPNYFNCTEDTLNALSRNLKDIKGLSATLDYSKQQIISSLFYELFIDLPIAEKNKWHLSHQAFFLRYGCLSGFDVYYNEILSAIYPKSAPEFKQLIEQYQGWQSYVLDFILEQELDIDENVIEALSEDELYALAENYFYNLQNICLPAPFIVPSAFSREQFLNGKLFFNSAYFWSKIENLDTNLFVYLNALKSDERLNLSTINQLLESVFNQDNTLHTNKRFLSGLSNQKILPDTISNAKIFSHQSLLLQEMISALNRLLKSLPMIYSNSAKSCQLVYSLRINGSFLNSAVDELLLHQLAETKLEVVCALVPNYVTSLTDEVLAQALYQHVFSLPSDAQTYLFSFWLNQKSTLQQIILEHASFKKIVQTYDISLNHQTLLISDYI